MTWAEALLFGYILGWTALYNRTWSCVRETWKYPIKPVMNYALWASHQRTAQCYDWLIGSMTSNRMLRYFSPVRASLIKLTLSFMRNLVFCCIIRHFHLRLFSSSLSSLYQFVLLFLSIMCWGRVHSRNSQRLWKAIITCFKLVGLHYMKMHKVRHKIKPT